MCKVERILVLVEDLQLQGIQANVEKLSYIQSQCDSAESIATPPDSDLEDEQLRKMLASPLYVREREENEGQARAYHPERESLMIHSSRNPAVSGEPGAECVQKPEASAQRTQADHSRREKLDVKFISRAESVRETECKVFHWETKNRETNSKVLFDNSLKDNLRTPRVSGKPGAECMHNEHKLTTQKEKT